MSKLKKGKEVKSSDFYFGKQNYQLMLLGIGLIVVGFLLMMGSDANTMPNGKYNPNYWNNDIFSIRRVRIAPLVVVLGFVVEVISILKIKKTNSSEH